MKFLPMSAFVALSCLGFLSLAGCPNSTNVKPTPSSAQSKADASVAMRGDGGLAVPEPEPPKPVKTGEQLFAEAVQMAQQKQLLPALERFKEAVKVKPSLHQAWFNIGVLQERMGNSTAAASSYRSALQAKADFPEAVTNLSRLYMRQQKVASVYALLEQKSRQFPKNLQYRNMLIQTYIRQGQLGRGEQMARSLQQKNEKNVDAIMNLGRVWFKQKKFELAEMAFRQAIRNQRRKPKPEPYYWRALVRQQQKLPLEAVEDLNKAIKLRSAYPEAHNLLGVLLMKLGRVSEASKHFQSAISFSPRFWDAHLNLGNALTALQKFKMAEQRYRTLLSQVPSYRTAHYHLGILYLDRPQLKGTLPEPVPPGLQQDLQLKYSKQIAKQTDTISRFKTSIYHLRTYINSGSNIPSDAPERNYLALAEKRIKSARKRLKSRIKRWRKKQLRMLKKKQKKAAARQAPPSAR